MRDDWPLTSKAIEQSEEPPLEFGDEPAPRGNALLRQIAEASDGRLVEVEPGMWFESKIDD